MFGQQSRMLRTSRIDDRNIYLHTDRLYQPLRNVLRKSTVSPSNRISQPSPVKVDRAMRSISPAQAELIKKKIFIPVDQELVPTGNVSKILGKRFTAVDANEKVGQPISENQLSRVRQGTVEEIVYQVREEPRENIYTTRSQFPTKQTTSRVVQFNRSPSPRVNFSMSTGQKSLQKTTIIQPLQSSPPPPPPPQPAPFTNHNNRDLLPVKSMTTVTALRNESNPSQLKSQNSKLYDFKGSAQSERSPKISRLRRDEYKYNLFSVIDEPSNTGCKTGCCHKNELVASRIQHNPWK